MTRQPRTAASARQRALIRRVLNALELPHQLPVPPDLTAALTTGRSDLIKMIQPRDLAAAESAQLLQLIGALMEANALLRDHARSSG